MNDNAKNYWLADIITAIRDIGDQANLRDIYRLIKRDRTSLPNEYEAVIRATIYAHSTDAGGYVSGNPDVFKKISRGKWALRFPEDRIPTHKMSEGEWVSYVIGKMTREELQSYSGLGDEFIEELRQRVHNARARYNTNP